MKCTGILTVPAPAAITSNRSSSKVRKKKNSAYCSLDCSNPTAVTQHETPKKFSYSRASPSVRWPHLRLPTADPPVIPRPPTHVVDNADSPANMLDSDGNDETHVNDEHLEVLGRPSRTRAKKLTKFALNRAKDWRRRIQNLNHAILQLKPEETAADTLDKNTIQMTHSDYCLLVKTIGQTNWQRAVEVYQWLNLRHWYTHNPQMLATVLSVLGKANQEAMAEQIFTKAEPATINTIQVHNAMMGVYARNGRINKVHELLNNMRKHGFQPDLVSFNTMINAKLRSTPMVPGLALALLNETRKSGIRPDIITYNTLLSGCSHHSNLEEATMVFEDMERNKCQPDLWTYNAMISVFGRCGASKEAERIFHELKQKGFDPDVVTYNSLLYAFAREGNLEKVSFICEEMMKKGFGKDETTYNTIIHMYGKRGQPDLALNLFRDMKSSGRNPDAITYTLLIDSLGKANKITEAEKVMLEMVNSGLKPTLRTYSALICGYAKAGNRAEAEKTFNSMLISGIKPDRLAYSIMLDIHLRSSQATNAMALYNEMVSEGMTPDYNLYEGLVRVLGKEKKENDVQKVVKDLEEFCNLNPQVISSILVKGECYEHAAKQLKLAIMGGHDLDSESLLSILSSYSSSGRYSEAQELLSFLKENAPKSHKLVAESLIVILCKDNQVKAALDEYNKRKNFGLFNGSFTLFESLINCCQESELFDEACQVFSDMRFIGLEPSIDLYKRIVFTFCKIGFPETAHYLIDIAEAKGTPIDNISVYVDLIEAYGKSKLLEKAEIVVGRLRERNNIVDRKAWNALINAYALSGCYEQARAAFNTMMRDGPSPTVESINGLMQALIVDNRLNELHVVIQELQDMGFQISKSSIILMLEAFAEAGEIFEVMKIYQGMKAAGYFPTMHLYRVMIGLLARSKKVRDVEIMESEMEVAGFKPDLSILNSMIKLYSGLGDYKKTAEVYRRILEAGLEPDNDTYNTLIVMYCRDRRPQEGLSLVHEMRRKGLDPKMATYKSLIAAFCKLKMEEEAEQLFKNLQLNGYKMDRSFYHLMMKMFRSTENHSKAEELLVAMKEAGVEPNIATMHLLMTSYGRSGHPGEAEEVLNNLKSSGADVTSLTYSSVIDGYLRNRDYNVAAQKVMEMKREEIEPDHRIWTCFIRAASLCHSSKEAIALLNAIGDAGFDLPVRLLETKSEYLILEIDRYLEKLESIEDSAAFNFVNALEDFLWAFELRATASWVFQLAIKRNIYRNDVFRVADKDWGADFRKLSAGAALVALTLWLDNMQDASLEGFPESPKTVVLITGASEYNNVSLNTTLKAYLWEMSSPFRLSKMRSGLFRAKGHSLKMWLKDSPFCMDLELKNSHKLPDTNSMQLIEEGCFIRRGLVSAFRDINKKLGEVRPKKFARLALLSDEKRERVILADIEGKKKKLEKMEKNGTTGKKISTRFTKTRRKFIGSKSHQISSSRLK